MFGSREMPCRWSSDGERCATTRYALAQAAKHIIERQQSVAAKLDDDRLLDSVRTVLFGLLGPTGWSAVEPRWRHFAVVLAFKPWRAARARVLSCDAWSSARIGGVVRAGVKTCCQSAILPLTAQGCTITLRD